MDSNNCEMVANSGLKEEEIELELGLSIGGSYRRQNATELKSDTSTFDMDSREKLQTLIRSSVSGQEITDPKTKREIHALRRQEAKKKREEKQLKKGGFCKGYFNGGQVINNGENVNNNNGIWLKAKAFQSKEGEIENEEPECKKSKTEDIGSDHNDSNKVNITLNIDQNNNGTCYSSPCTSSPVLPAVLPVQYGHPPLQYGPPANGFVYPCANLNVMPCWFTTGEERNLVQVQPVVSYGFLPFQAASDRGHNLGNGYDSEQNGSRDGGNTKVGSNGSPMCASSTGSDHRTSSHEGGGSSDTRSRSCPSIPEQRRLNNDSKENDAKGPSEHSATSQLTESTHVENKLVQSSQMELKEEAKVEAESNITNKQILTPENSSPSMDSKSDSGKPPKPQTQNHSNPSLPYMPCVSTTGNGPNGKTVNGFLYRYTKTEVSIICVCHGSSFSPAEFVQHAGGTDVSHPLKHITVIPSAF